MPKGGKPYWNEFLRQKYNNDTITCTSEFCGFRFCHFTAVEQ